MNSAFPKTPTALLTAIVLLPLAACSDMSEGIASAESGEKTGVMFRIAGAPAQKDSEERLGPVELFHFNAGGLQLRSVVEDPYADDILLPSQAGSRIYCLGGLNLDCSMGMKEDAFTASIAESGASEAPLFYSASVDFSEAANGDRQVAVEMKRSVARIDFTNTEATGFRVSQVIVEDAPEVSYVFETEKAVECGTVSYTREFEQPFYGTEEGLFRLFESENPVHIRILGEYKDSPLNIRSTLPRVERNKAYTLEMVNANSMIEGAFTVKDWEEGVSVTARPTASGAFAIDPVNSSIPDNVTADLARKVITVTHAGASGIKVAFAAPSKISVASLEGEVPTLRITPNEAVAVEGGYLSSFNVSVDPNNRLSYKVTVNLRDDAGRTDFVEIKVLENPSRPFDTVEIAGRTWMAFNAMSADPADQVFPVDGLTVEEMYRSNWAMAIGNFFQYGRALAYSPWTRNDPTGNDETTRDIPWATAEAMPLPVGYHVATAADWQALMPNGTTFPSTYTAGNGEEIKAELVTLPGTLTSSPSASANRAGLLMRYMRFESLKTGNVLIIPICGMKTASLDEYPGGGRALHAWGGYWIAEDRNIWLFQVTDTEQGLAVAQGINKWNYNGFMAVRGVKDAD